MNEVVKRAHWSFWIIAVFALVWNGLGSVNFAMQMNPDIVEAYRESERAIIVGRPLWATAGFAVGVIGGAIGGLLLLLRRALALSVFVASLIGVLITMIHTIQVAASPAEFGYVGLFVMIVLPTLVAIFLVWYARYASRKGWIA